MTTHRKEDGLEMTTGQEERWTQGRLERGLCWVHSQERWCPEASVSWPRAGLPLLFPPPRLSPCAEPPRAHTLWERRLGDRPCLIAMPTLQSCPTLQPAKSPCPQRIFVTVSCAFFSDLPLAALRATKGLSLHARQLALNLPGKALRGSLSHTRQP